MLKKVRNQTEANREHLGSFKRKNPSASDLWLQNVVKTPESYGFLGYEEDASHSESSSRKNDIDRHPDHQTYSKWKAVYKLQKVSHPLRMRRRTLVIQPLRHVNTHREAGGEGKDNKKSSASEKDLDPSVLGMLQKFCRAFFPGMDVVVAQTMVLSTHRIRWRIHSITQSVQVHAEDLYRHMRRGSRIKCLATIGVVNSDLYPGDDWNFCLGHASTSEGCGVFSLGHYHDQRQSVEEIDAGDLQYQLSRFWRLIKVIAHETCHMFGMRHCSFFQCLMNESSSVDEAESQPLFLCPVCLRKLLAILKFDIRTRYELMLRELTELRDKVVATCHCDSIATGDTTEPSDSSDCEDLAGSVGSQGEVLEPLVWHVNVCDQLQAASQAPLVDGQEHFCQLLFMDQAIRRLKGQLLA